MKPLVALAIFIIGSLCLAAFYPWEILLAVAVGAFSIAAIAHCGLRNLKSYIIAVLAGGFCENTAVWLGGWKYTNAAFLPAPLWLPLGWGFSILLFEEAFGKKIPVKFSPRAALLAVGGTVAAALLSGNELLVLGLFVLVTVVLFKTEFYKREEFVLGVYAAALGTFMEALSIFTGNWQYSAAILQVPLWLPLCWFNAYLIMRRIIRLEI